MSSSPPLDEPGAAAPLVLSEQGSFWVGVGRRQTEAGTVPEAAMYVQFQIPADLRHPLPVVMVHGGGGQGSLGDLQVPGRQAVAEPFKPRPHVSGRQLLERLSLSGLLPICPMSGVKASLYTDLVRSDRPGSPPSSQSSTA
jgi:hypothetical protein